MRDSGEHDGDIDVTPLRKRFFELEERGVTASDITRRLGYVWDGRLDVTRFKRHLGLKPWKTGGREGANRRVRYDTARRLCEALELDPHEVEGL